MVVKQPQDHQKKSTTEDAPEEYRFTIDGRDLVVPSLGKAAGAGFLRKNRNRSMQDFMMLLIETLLDKDELELFDSMDLLQMNDFFEGWQKESGIQLPESSAS